VPPPGQFPTSVVWPLQPAGTFLSFGAGSMQARVYRDSGHVELAGADLAGAPGANVVRITPPAVQLQSGTVLVGGVLASSTIAGGLELQQALGSGRISTRLTSPVDGVLRYEVTDWGGATPQAIAFAGPLIAGEHLYGFGEKFNGLDQTGKIVQMLTFDEPGLKDDRSYKVAPWFMSTRGYGIHLDSSAQSTFDMGAGAPGRYVVTSPVPPMAVHLVHGPRLTDVLTRYTAITGRPLLPPPFTFGVWISSDIWRSGGELRYAVMQFRRRGIPASAVVFDSPWETAYNDFQFNMTQFGQDATIDGEHFDGFASLGDMMSFVQSNGLKAICWMSPFVDTSSDDEHVAGQNLAKAANYDDAASKSFFVGATEGGAPLVVPWWKGKGSPVDFTNAAAAAWLQDQLRTLIAQSEVTTRSGGREAVIGGFKTDDGESGNQQNTYVPEGARYADGRTGAQMRNGYCLEYHRAVSGVLGEKGTLFARSGFSGSQAFPGCWAGDNEPNFGDNGLPGVIIAGQSAAMSGFAIWGHDVGGYQDTNFSVSPPDLFMRWTQFGCFSPIMQMHRQVARELQYPWRFGDAALQNYVLFAKLHVRLFPYLYAYAEQASRTGLPIIRPLVLLDQTDPNTFGLQHVYLFGDALLVAPVVAPNATTRVVYLPQGAWVDFWSNERHPGGQSITWSNPDRTRFPLFAREGAIIPMLLTEPQTLCEADYVNNPAIITPDAGLLVLVYPGGASTFSLFDRTQIACQMAGQQLTITLTSAPRPLLLRILMAPPAQVTRDGTIVPNLPAPPSFDAAQTGWQPDGSTGFILVKFQHAGGATTVVL
jgi:alpha-D-xyloside xylohydrolase